MSKKVYRRLSEKEKELIKKLALEGKSLRKISALLNREITTVYYHFKKLRRPQKRLFQVALSQGEIGELVGAFAGDGSFYHSKHGRSSKYRVSYHLCFSKDRDYALRIYGFLKKCNLNPFLFTRQDQDTIDVVVNSKDYVEFLRKYVSWKEKRCHTIRLKDKLDGCNSEFLRGFVRGLMDTDGFVEVSNVSCGSISGGLIDNLASIFDLFGLDYKRSLRLREPQRKSLHLIRVYRKSLALYAQLFGFSNCYKQEKLNMILKK